jgi:hypothetical protein
MKALYGVAFYWLNLFLFQPSWKKQDTLWRIKPLVYGMHEASDHELVMDIGWLPQENKMKIGLPRWYPPSPVKESRPNGSLLGQWMALIEAKRKEILHLDFMH